MKKFAPFLLVFLLAAPATAVVVRLIGTYGHRYVAVSSTLCNSGEVCIYNDVADGLAKLHKADNTVVQLGTTSGSAYATVQDEATPLTQRATINFTGAGVSCVDNSGSTRTDCTITSGGGGGTRATVYAAGANAADQTETIATAKGGAAITKDDGSYTGSLVSVTNNGGTTKYLDITNNAGQTYTSAVADGSGVYGHTFNDVPALTTGYMARWQNNSVNMARLQDTGSAVVFDGLGRNIVQLTTLFGGSTSNVTVTSNTSAALNAFGASVTAATNAVTISAPVTTMNSAYKVKRTTVADTAYTVLAADYYVEYTTLTATRAVTLPTAVLGQIYVVVDGVGNANTNNITFTSGSTISGLTTINTAFGVRTFYGTTSRWIGY